MHHTDATQFTAWLESRYPDSYADYVAEWRESRAVEVAEQYTVVVSLPTGAHSLLGNRLYRTLENEPDLAPGVDGFHVLNPRDLEFDVEARGRDDAARLVTRLLERCGVRGFQVAGIHLEPI